MLRITIIATSIVLFLVLLTNCKDSTGPSSPEVDPSILSVVFTGDSLAMNCDNYRFATIDNLSKTDALSGKGCCQVTASWTICDEPEFSSYVLYRSTSPDIESDPSAADIIAILNSSTNTTFVDSTTVWAQDYYYALYTLDSNDRAVWSNEAYIHTPGTNPTPSELSVDSLAYSFALLSWSMCLDTDFQLYRLYRSSTPGLSSDTTQAVCVISSDSPDLTTFTDDTPPNNENFYYCLLIINNKGFTSWSNEIEAFIPKEFPDQIYTSIPVGSSPSNLCVSPDDEYIYVTNKESNNVSVLRTSDFSVIETFNVGQGPIGLCILNSGSNLYIANSEDNTVTVYDTGQFNCIATIPVGECPTDICTIPSDEYVYVCNRYDNTASVISTADNSVVDTINLSTGSQPVGICSTPSGQYVYAIKDQVSSVIIISTSSNNVVDTYGGWTNGHLSDVFFSPSGDYVYLVLRGYDEVWCRHAHPGWGGVATYSVNSNPTSGTVLPSGDYFYITNSYNDNVSVGRCEQTQAILTTIPVGDGPTDIASSSDGEWVYVTSSNDNRVYILN